MWAETHVASAQIHRTMDVIDIHPSVVHGVPNYLDRARCRNNRQRPETLD